MYLILSLLSYYSNIKEWRDDYYHQSKIGNLLIPCNLQFLTKRRNNLKI